MVVGGVRRAVVGAVADAVLDPVIATIERTLHAVAEEAHGAAPLHAATRALHVGRRAALVLAHALVAGLCAEQGALGEHLGLAHGRLELDNGLLEVRLDHALLLLVLELDAGLQRLNALLLVLPRALVHNLGHLSRADGGSGFFRGTSKTNGDLI